jgi:hypothetical protein
MRHNGQWHDALLLLRFPTPFATLQGLALCPLRRENN